MNATLNHDMITRLISVAQQECFYDDEDDDVVVDDYAGGNVDDAFATGERAGETMMARSILEDLGIDWSANA